MRTGQDPRLRLATTEDADAIAQLIRISFATQPVILEPPASALQETAANVASIILRGGGGVASTHAIVAAVLWQPTERGLYISRLSVHPDWRRNGLALALLLQAETRAGQLGFTRIWLSVRLALVGNRRLFASCGFVETRQHAHPGHSTPTYVDMEKPVEG